MPKTKAATKMKADDYKCRQLLSNLGALDRKEISAYRKAIKFWNSQEPIRFHLTLEYTSSWVIMAHFSSHTNFHKERAETLQSWIEGSAQTFQKIDK